MAKKKRTMVVMPGAMADLAHSVQRVNTSVANANADDKQADNEEVEVVDKTEEEPQEEVQQAVEQVENERPTAVEQSTEQVVQTADTEPETQQSRFGQVSAIDAVNDEKDRTAPAAKKLPKAEGRQLAREYSMAKDSGEDSWQLFLDLARDYKMRDSRLATVYIDSNLKSVLDRLKSATSIKLPSTAILSAIVARFVFEHEKDIKNAIFGESLL
ncbi:MULTISPECIES: hypothetical protein [unclassified Prevotella]|jgi:hypothetical protein|uniref:hypothetical protein n=1 Tax=Prevotella sp. 20925_1_30 TaxID=3003679 RepID=UPI001CAD1DBB|nr:hypothetical protein [Prevotella sp.]MBF1629091.1 hypothetical protein [Prevotella sp.]